MDYSRLQYARSSASLNTNQHPAVKANLEQHVNDPMKISTITLKELHYGAGKSEMVSSNLAKVRTSEGLKIVNWRERPPV